MKNNENQLLQHPYQPNIKLADFEGPLDLLLHLIRQSEMDIYDIPIARSLANTCSICARCSVISWKLPASISLWRQL